MTRIDKYRVGVSILLAVLGLVIVARAVSSQVWPIAILGLVMLALGLYRLKQFRKYWVSARS